MDIERSLGPYLGMLVHSYNPDRYVGMMEYPWRRFAKFFLATLAIALLLFVATFLPLAMRYIGTMPQTLQEVDRFQISSDIEAARPVELLAHPSVVLDLTGNATREGRTILITHDGISYPSYGLFGTTFVNWSQVNDLKTPTPERDKFLYGALIFLLPSIIFWCALASVRKLLLASVALMIVAYFLPRLFRHRISLSETVKSVTLAMPSVMLIGVGLSPLAPGPMFWWGLLLTVGVLAIAVVLLSERKAGKEGRAQRGKV